MLSSTFLKNFGASVGICAAAALVIGGGAAFLAGGITAATIPVIGAAAATAGLATSGVLAFTQFILTPVAEFFVGFITLFAGARVQESNKVADRAFAIGTGLSAVISAAALGAASLQGAYNRTAERTEATADFHCPANETRVEQIVTGADGKRTLTVTCQRR